MRKAADGKRRHRAIYAVLGAALLLALAAGIYLGRYSRSDPEVSQFLESGGSVTVERISGGWRFDGPGEGSAVIFYPGGKVETEAYAPLLYRLAESGEDCFLAEMPVRLAITKVGAAADIMAGYDYDEWILAGHSLGGAAAAMYAARDGSGTDGLVLLAAYPTKPLPDGLRLLSVYGSEDGVLDLGRYEGGKACWPRDSAELVIEGGNHAQFGDYGVQKGDGDALISREEQQRMTVDAVLRWLGR